MRARPIVGLVVLALAGWALAAIFTTPKVKAEPVQFESSAQCGACHAEQQSEWQESWHAQAWTDVEVRKLSNDFANTDCIDCHAPRPVFETGIKNRVLPRFVRQIEGVDCISCHLQPDGRVAGTIDDPTAPCRPTANRELVQPDFCGGCHNQHGTVDQWKASRFAVPGPEFKSCVDCHMPPRNGDPAQGRDHTMHGGHDIELVKSAVTLTASRGAGGRAQVAIENVAAGHNFPTDERSRAADVFWRPVGASDWRHLYRFRNPYRYEVGLPNTELAAGARVELPIEGEGAAGALEVALFFKLTPYWLDEARPDPEREAKLLHKVEVAP